MGGAGRVMRVGMPRKGRMLRRLIAAGMMRRVIRPRRMRIRIRMRRFRGITIPGCRFTTAGITDGGGDGGSVGPVKPVSDNCFECADMGRSVLRPYIFWS